MPKASAGLTGRLRKTSKTTGKAKAVRLPGALLSDRAAIETSRTSETHEGRASAVMKAAQNAGLLGEKTGRLGVRVSPTLLEAAKRTSGIEADTRLIEYALANVALDDDFARVFEESRGTVDPDLKLGY